LVALSPANWKREGLDTRIPGVTRPIALLATACALALAACGETEEVQRPESATPTPAAPSTAREPVHSGAASSTRMPAAGGVELYVDGEKVTLLANAAPRLPVLQRLARALGFTLVAPDVFDEPITVNGVDVELRDLLPQLLPDRPYAVAYNYDAVERVHRVARLEIGLLGTVSAPGLTASKRATNTVGPLEDVAREKSAPRQRRPAPARELSWHKVLEQLDDSDWEERSAAIDQIEPKGEGLAVLVERLANDPHAKVRGAAAEQLGGSDTLLAIDALIAALQDPDKQVVLEAIDALEFTDDETVVKEIAPLQYHKDADIREAAADAVCFIGECD
jgi:hypothetical protein